MIIHLLREKMDMSNNSNNLKKHRLNKLIKFKISNKNYKTKVKKEIRLVIKVKIRLEV